MAQMPVGPLQVRLPDPTTLDAANPDALVVYLRTLNTSIATAFAQRPAVSSPTADKLLLSPNGSVYALKVDDAGVISAALVRDNA